MEVGDIEVFIGIDVGKSEHWATAPTRAGRSVCHKALPNDEVRPPGLYKVPTEHGSLPVVVDQPATIGAPAVAVAQDRGPGRCRLPGRDPGQDLQHRRAAGLLRRLLRRQQAPQKSRVRLAPRCAPSPGPTTSAPATRESAVCQDLCER